ncbi:hypothetical protein HED54_11130 [Ochrobactrum anthropi ATCC 49188]|nr:hypothetical protein [Brucella anthropi ATCC 49188]
MIFSGEGFYPEIGKSCKFSNISPHLFGGQLAGLRYCLDQRQFFAFDKTREGGRFVTALKTRIEDRKAVSGEGSLLYGHGLGRSHGFSDGFMQK